MARTIGLTEKVLLALGWQVICVDKGTNEYDSYHVVYDPNGKQFDYGLNDIGIHNFWQRSMFPDYPNDLNAAYELFVKMPLSYRTKCLDMNIPYDSSQKFATMICHVFLEWKNSDKLQG